MGEDCAPQRLTSQFRDGIEVLGYYLDGCLDSIGFRELGWEREI